MSRTVVFAQKGRCSVGDIRCDYRRGVFEVSTRRQRIRINTAEGAPFCVELRNGCLNVSRVKIPCEPRSVLCWILNMREIVTSEAKYLEFREQAELRLRESGLQWRCLEQKGKNWAFFIGENENYGKTVIAFFVTEALWKYDIVDLLNRWSTEFRRIECPTAIARALLAEHFGVSDDSFHKVSDCFRNIHTRKDCYELPEGSSFTYYE